MTFEQLIANCGPMNPLIVNEINLSYVSKTATIQLAYPSHNPSSFEVTLDDLHLCCIEPPSQSYVDNYWEDGGSELYVSASVGHQSPRLEEITTHLDSVPLPNGLQRVRLLVHSWNSYIHLAYRTSRITSEVTDAI